MPPILLAFAILLSSGLLALLISRWPRLSSIIGSSGAMIGCVIGFVQSLRVLIEGRIQGWTAEWSVPFGSLSIEIDSLSAMFLLPLLGLSALAAMYGQEYLAVWRGRKSLGAVWLFFNALVASMMMVVIARNAVLFLIAWELMSLTSFFLVAFEHEAEETQRAGWLYLVATHIGTAFLFALFILLGTDSASLDFSSFKSIPSISAGLLFLFAAAGFGTKAGFMPFHIWLPEAHPAAPSHVSALMSGVMIKTGIYGLVRMLTYLGPPAPWWGLMLIGIGLTSGILGVLLALAQQDIKRLLAYSTVENTGIIAIGLGMGLLGLSYHEPVIVIAGFSGALLHVVNHAVFKGLLFLGAGAVSHATGTREIDRLGGLLKRMPWTGSTFLVGATAICGLPPLNGFISEWLIYLGAFNGVLSEQTGIIVPALGLVIGLALIGGIAAACCAKAFGIVYLGTARSEEAAHAHEVGFLMRISMLILAVICVAIGLTAPVIGRVMIRVVGDITAMDSFILANIESDLTSFLFLIVVASVALVVLSGLIVLLRLCLLRRREVGNVETWACGYLKPDARMQYTASSFAQPLTHLFRVVLGFHKQAWSPQGLFPKDASFVSETTDVFKERLYKPVFTALESAVGRLRWLQHGRLQLYVLYIAVTLLVLLIWKL